MTADPAGHWSLFSTGLTISDIGGRMWVEFAGVAGVGAVLHPHADGWIFEGGPADGAVVDFDAGLVGGIIPITRLDEPPAPLVDADVTVAPLTNDPERDAEFEEVWSLASGPLEWRSARPKHEFLHWLMDRDEVVFHGSNTAGIDSFSTERKSVELDDPTGRGNLTAVYATPDAYWATYFAICDRRRIEGSLRNGVFECLLPEGGRTRQYYLSLSTHDLEKRPFVTGTVYLLPRDTFAPIRLYDDGPPTWEWASFESVEPIASITIAPEDYPLLDRIGGHDETERIMYARAAEAVLSLVVEVETVTPKLRLRLSDPPPADAATDYVRLGSAAWPGTDRRVDGTLVVVEGPDDYRQAIARRFRSPD